MVIIGLVHDEFENALASEVQPDQALWMRCSSQPSAISNTPRMMNRIPARIPITTRTTTTLLVGTPGSNPAIRANVPNRRM
jgi:hypothetical protein